MPPNRLPRRSLSQRSELIYDAHTFGVNLDTREVFLHSYEDSKDDSEIGIDFRAATKFVRNLRLLEAQNSKTVLVHLCSDGGDWEYGMAIYDAIQTARSKVVILAYGPVYSMSSVILQAADKRVMMPNADFMIHWGTEAYEGHSPTVQSDADWCKKINERMLEIYVEAARGSSHFKHARQASIREYLRAKMNQGNWYLLAREAVTYGFADAVLGDPGYEHISKLRS